MIRALAVLLAVLVGSQAGATIYTVQNTNDSGTRSLEWAIGQANAHAGRDVIRFAPRLSGRSIVLQTRLPQILDDQTIIRGDIDADGSPDVVLNGKNLSHYCGLDLRNVERCTIAGLVIVNFPSYAISLYQSSDCTIRSCHLGVNLAGTRARRNYAIDIRLESSHHNTIGGASPADRNIIGGALGAASGRGIHLKNSNGNVVLGNYFGTTRDGTAALGGGDIGVTVTGGDGNIIGGTTDGERNLFGGLGTGVALIPATNTVIAGNYFGLAADGDTVLPIRLYGVLVAEGATGNRIGGTAAGARNAFAGAADAGVMFRSPGTENNRVQGNYFGLNASGTQQRRLETGVKCHHLPGGAAGPQTIGGSTAAAGNYFTPKTTGTAYGVYLNGSGAGSLIKHNTFGVRPDGRHATGTFRGVSVWEVVAHIADNRFVGAERAIEAMDVGANPRVYRNRFRNCEMAVAIGSTARCRLGDLGNASTGDDGGNVFRRTGLYHIENRSPRRILAEGNDFGTTSTGAINAKIWDRRDDPDVGRVDFSPLMGGALPTGATLVVTAATAMPTAAGAQIVFTVSAPASVTATVRNLAGRPVRTLCRARDCNPGGHTLSWNAQSDRGVSVPSGMYLVELLAASPDGGQARALTAVRIER